MDFSQSDDRRMLSESLTRFLADQYPIEHRNKVAYELPCHDMVQFAAMAELGILAALAHEEVGGFGGAGFDISTVFQALGRALCPEPILPVVMASRLLATAKQGQQDLLAGKCLYGVALGELEAPYDLSHITTTAAISGQGFSLSGRKNAVYGGQVAQKFLVAAMLEGTPALFGVEMADAETVGYPMIDGGGAAELLLQDTPAQLLLSDAGAALQDACNAGIVALCAEAVGAMDATYEMVLEYLRTRQQFGRPIGSFQALQHRCVDMLTEIEQARSITIKAAAELDGPDGTRFAAMAKAMIGTVSRMVSEEAIQMHGGIAMTWEAPVSHYAKRLVMIDAQLGDVDHHLGRVMGALFAP